MFEQMSSTPVLMAPVLASQQPVRAAMDSQVDVQKSLLFAAIENFADGLVIVAKTGEILHRNRCAHRLLKLMEQPRQTIHQTIKALPGRIWQTCQTLMYADEPVTDAVKVVLEDEIRVPSTEQSASEGRIRVRVQWFNAEAQDCFLVMLEDCVRSAECSAQNEAYRYQLTPREAEVWQLKRSDYTYKEIAQQLYISENTVKKHLKNVYAKRDQFA